MPDTPIDNPVLNTPYAEPSRHFRFSDDGITDEVVPGRRKSAYFVPIAPPRKQGQQLVFDTQWTPDRMRPNEHVNQIRERVALWRQGGYVDVTPVTRRLLEYWTDAEREKKFFFCQIEALETAIYLTEAAHKYNDVWIVNELREANDTSNPGLPRIAFKMATGSGKTVVMAMLIAWQTVNAVRRPGSKKFTRGFLIVTPGITIRDRLRVLKPEEPDNYYRERDVVPSFQMEQLGRAKILITNFHAFQQREKVKAAALTKKILAEGTDGSAFTETPDEMVRRVCRELGTKKNIIVLNDEAHHCYRRRPDTEIERLSLDEKSEVKQREEEARIWISGIEAIKSKMGVEAIYDLSATPFFLRGSGYDEGTLFPWVVSDFSLIDSIEAGIVKVPRVPVADDAMSGRAADVPRSVGADPGRSAEEGRKTEALTGEPILPMELQGALHSAVQQLQGVVRCGGWRTPMRARRG